MKKILFKMLFFVGIVCSHAVLAQTTVTGTVTDSANGSPLPGVNVIVKGTSNGVSTDFDGNYSIDVDNDAILQFSFVGYVKQEISVNGKTSINVALKEDAQALDEVTIVTALGIKKQSRELGYAAQNIKSDAITLSTPVDIAQGLQGKVAGLNIDASNGLSNASSRIVIRGNNSLFGRNQPLIVVDGAIVENRELVQGNVGSSTDVYRDWGNYLSYLDMTTVEDVTVLKGPNAAALYGARGANGVILITSKKGEKRSGLGIEYSLSSNFTNVSKQQDVQNEYGGGFRASLYTANPQLPKTENGQSFPSVLYPWQGEYPNSTGINSSHGLTPGGYNTWDIFSWFGAGSSWGPKLDGTQALWWDGETRAYAPQPNNRDYMYKQGVETIHNVSFATANDFGSIRIGVNRKDGDAVVNNTNYNSTSFSLGSHVNISKMLSADINASYNQNFRLNAPEIGNNNSWSKFNVYGMSREYIGLEKDFYQRDDLHESKYNFPASYPHQEYSRDMFWDVYNNNSRLWRDEFLSTIKLNAEITPWLNAFVRTSVDLIGTKFETTSKTKSTDGLGGGNFYKTVSKDKSYNTDIMATLHKDDFLTEGFNASLTLGYNSFSINNSGVKGKNDGRFKVPGIYSLSNYSTIDNTKHDSPESRYQVESFAYIGLLDLSYKNYLFLQVTAREDANSTLPKSDNTTFYPSMNASFVFSEALDLGSFGDVLNYGQLRFAWGKSANADEPYQLDATFNTSTFGPATTITYPDKVPPAELVFQTSESKEIGLALGFFNNRLNVDFTYYDIYSHKQIMEAAIPLSSGAAKVKFNSGVLTNKGFDFIINAGLFRTEDFSWDVSINGNKNKNKVVSLSEGVEEKQIASVFGANGAFMKVSPGDEYGTIYGTDFERDAQGRKQVTNILNKDGSGDVVGTQYVVGKDPVKIGNAAPKLRGGIGNNFRYKNFRFSALVDFKIGGDIYSVDHATAMGSGLSPITLKERNGGGLPYTFPDGTTDNVGMIMDGFNVDDNQENTRVIHPVYYYGITYAGWSHLNRPRSLSVFENTWVKLREISLSYQVPQSVLEKTKIIDNLSLSLVGRNLFYIYSSLPDNLNPEAINGTGNGQGLQWSQFPQMRTFGFSLKAGF